MMSREHLGTFFHERIVYMDCGISCRIYIFV
jgi:hypothetical protein